MGRNKKDRIVLYAGRNGKVEFRADTDKETLWATQTQIGEVFGCSIDNVSLHLKNIFKDKELDQRSTTEDSSVVQIEGSRSIRRPVTLYNLDAIIAVGYRVNSKKATQFRIWATGILREYLINGYSLDQRKLTSFEGKFEDLRKAVDFMEFESVGGKLKAKISVRLSKDLI
jgi:hypothetical protein